LLPIKLSNWHSHVSVCSVCLFIFYLTICLFVFFVGTSARSIWWLARSSSTRLWDTTTCFVSSYFYHLIIFIIIIVIIIDKSERQPLRCLTNVLTFACCVI
jgi:hypothetical protein